MKHCILIVISFLHFSLHGQQIKLTAGATAVQSPVEIHFTKALNKAAHYMLVEKATGKKIPAQALDSFRLVIIPLKPIPPGREVMYKLIQSGKRKKMSDISIVQSNQGILVKIKKKPLLFYHIKEALPPIDSPALYKRSGFIHPLHSPNGRVLTDDFPVAHIHQHAIFSAWTSTRFKNKAVDFWNQHNKTGTVEHNRIIGITEGPVFTEIITELNYKSLAHGNVLSEQWKLKIYPFSEYFLFDLESVQRNITVDTLYLNTYHYGGMAFRGSREWNPDDKKYFSERWNILTSEGKKDSAANHTHARWVDASGKISGKAAGAAVLNHSSNYRYPQAIRVHPYMPYWSYAPVIDGGFEIAPGQVYTSRFRYYIHNNLPDVAFTNQLHREWVEPPTVTVSN